VTQPDTAQPDTARDGPAPPPHQSPLAGRLAMLFGVVLIVLIITAAVVAGLLSLIIDSLNLPSMTTVR
jgi:hypothetical protein